MAAIIIIIITIIIIILLLFFFFILPPFNVVTFYLSAVMLVWFVLFFVGEAGLITLVSLTCLSTFLRHVSFVILCVV